jgi:hypothetical protein
MEERLAKTMEEKFSEIEKRLKQRLLEMRLENARTVESTPAPEAGSSADEMIL